MSTTQQYKVKIAEKLGILELQLRRYTDLGLADEKKAMEPIVCKLLNLVYGYGLINLNDVQHDYPAIDLGSSAYGIAIQVTSSNSRDKVRETIQGFERHALYRQYSRLIVFVTGERKEFSKAFQSSHLHFSADDDIWDFHTLIKDIDHLGNSDFDRLQAIYEFLELEYPSCSPKNACAFHGDQYVQYLEAHRDACALLPSPEIEFVRDEPLFKELDIFLMDHWLDQILKEIADICNKNGHIQFDRNKIDIRASLKKNAAVIKSWIINNSRNHSPITKQLDQIARKLDDPFYRNCMFISGYYGSGKTRLIAEAAWDLWNTRSDKKPVFLFVNPHDPADIANSICTSCRQLFGMDYPLETCLGAFVNEHTLVIVLDDIHEYFQQGMTVKKIFDLVDKFSRPNVKWILLTQTGYGKDPDDLYCDIYSKYAHKWSGVLRDRLVGQWFQLDDWYRKSDIPRQILQNAENSISADWAWKSEVCSTNYYNPLLANVLIIHAHREKNWSFLHYNNLHFPEFCRRYYHLLSQNKETVAYETEKVADYFWSTRKLQLHLTDSPFCPDDINCLVNHGLLYKTDTSRIGYRGTPDIVWHYLLAEFLNDQIDQNVSDSLHLADWKDNAADFNHILSIWVLSHNRSAAETTDIWKTLFRHELGSVALDSGFKCSKELRNQLVSIALKHRNTVRSNFTLFMRLCALGQLERDTLYDVIDFCVFKCRDEIRKYGDLFAYMLLQNYASMDWIEVLWALDHLAPLLDKGMPVNILRRLGDDIGRTVARKAGDALELSTAITGALRACDKPISNQRFPSIKSQENEKSHEFPVDLFDGFCSGFCNTVIRDEGIAGYDIFIACNWYSFCKNPDLNQLRRNIALTFALAFEYRYARPGSYRSSEYSQWYEDELVGRLADGGIEQKTFAVYLIMHSGLKENNYLITGNTVLKNIAIALSSDKSMRNVLSRPAVSRFYKANFGEEFPGIPHRISRGKRRGKPGYYH